MSRRSNAQVRSPAPPARRQGGPQRALRETVALQAARIDQLQRQVMAAQAQMEALASQVAMLVSPRPAPAEAATPAPLPEELERWLPVFLREGDGGDPSDWMPGPGPH